MAEEGENGFRLKEAPFYEERFKVTKATNLLLDLYEKDITMIAQRQEGHAISPGLSSEVEILGDILSKLGVGDLTHKIRVELAKQNPNWNGEIWIGEKPEKVPNTLEELNPLWFR